MQLNLGFDLDEVVVNITDEIEKYLKYKYDIYWPAECFKEYGLIDGTYHADEKLNKTIQDDLWKVASEWLKHNNIPFDKLKVIGHGEEKGVYGSKLDLDMFVDDLEKHLVSMFNHKKMWNKGLLLFDRPWNVNDIIFDRVNGWKEIVDYVENNT